MKIPCVFLLPLLFVTAPLGYASQRDQIFVKETAEAFNVETSEYEGVVNSMENDGSSEPPEDVQELDESQVTGGADEIVETQAGESQPVESTNQHRRNAKAPRERESKQGAKDELAQQLLQRAAAIGSQLSDSDRAFLLSRLAQASARKQPKQSGAWADEVFAITAGLPAGGPRNQSEMNAVQAAADVDPQHGLQPLGRMEGSPIRDNAQPVMDVRPAVAMQVFQRYWQKNGIDGLDALIAAAHKMSESGAYPYLAVGPLVRQVKAKDADRAQALISDALTFYTRRQRTSLFNQELVMFLRLSQDLVPKNLMKEILQQLVKESLDAASDSTRVNAEFSDDTGRSARITNSSSLVLLQIIPLARQVDPEWAKKLEEQHSELRDVANLASANGGNQRLNVGLVVGPDGKPSSPERTAEAMDEMKSVQIDELSSRDPQRALKLSQEIQNPSRRAAVNAQIGAELAKSDPEQSAALLKQAREALAETKDSNEKLCIMVGLAQAQATMHDGENLPNSMATAFTLGEELFRRGVDKNPNAPVFTQPGFDSLSRLTNLSVKFDSTAALANLENLRSPLLQAHLLIAAAEALDPESKMRRPGMRVVINN